MMCAFASFSERALGLSRTTRLSAPPGRPSKPRSRVDYARSRRPRSGARRQRRAHAAPWYNDARSGGEKERRRREEVSVPSCGWRLKNEGGEKGAGCRAHQVAWAAGLPTHLILYSKMFPRRRRAKTSRASSELRDPRAIPDAATRPPEFCSSAPRGLLICFWARAGPLGEARAGRAPLDRLRATGMALQSPEVPGRGAGSRSRRSPRSPLLLSRCSSLPSGV